MNKVIPVSVRDKIATKTGDDVYVCGNSDFVIEFDFDSEWDEFDTKTARFEWNDGHHDTVFSGNTCPVPIISDTHRFYVGVFAGNLRTTTAAYVPAKKSILCRGGSPHNPPPDVYAQIMEKLNSMSGGDVSPEAIEAAVNKYLEEHPIESGGIDEEQLEQAVQDALKEAKESGDFDGPAGADGKDGADGISPSVTVQDIEGGHRVSITDKDGTKVFDVMDGKDGAGGTGGDSPAIIDVAVLPETDIREDAFYRVVTVDCYYGGEPSSTDTVYVVDELPEVGMPALDEDGYLVVYYSVKDEAVRGYASEDIAAMVGIEPGWYPFELVAQLAGNGYAGIVESEDEVSNDPTTFCFLKKKAVLYRNNDTWESIQNIGRNGTGFSAETFNSTRNTASGEYSHAEGFNTIADDFCSHAEGVATKSRGRGAHSEGVRSEALGDYSHAEGYYTIAQCDYQHVSGVLNIPDNNSLVVVGNGDFASDKRSNAYTLDTRGNGWFAGTVECTAIILVGGDGKLYKVYIDGAGVMRTERA